MYPKANYHVPNVPETTQTVKWFIYRMLKGACKNFESNNIHTMTTGFQNFCALQKINENSVSEKWKHLMYMWDLISCLAYGTVILLWLYVKMQSRCRWDMRWILQFHTHNAGWRIVPRDLKSRKICKPFVSCFI